MMMPVTLLIFSGQEGVYSNVELGPHPLDNNNILVLLRKGKLLLADVCHNMNRRRSISNQSRLCVRLSWKEVWHG
jgi:hypothetical protein